MSSCNQLSYLCKLFVSYNCKYCLPHCCSTSLNFSRVLPYLGIILCTPPPKNPPPPPPTAKKPNKQPKILAVFNLQVFWTVIAFCYLIAENKASFCKVYHSWLSGLKLWSQFEVPQIQKLVLLALCLTEASSYDAHLCAFNV